jgi:hypothetical protein
MKKITSLLLAVMLVAGAANAQSISLDTIKAQLVKDWERAKAYTNEYLAAMPADKYGARAQDSVRTFSEQMLHLSMGNISLTSAGTGYRKNISRVQYRKIAGRSE